MFSLYHKLVYGETYMTTVKKEGMEPDLAALADNLELIKKAVRRSNPLLRSVAESRLYPILALVYGLLIILFCLLTRDAQTRGLEGPLGFGSIVPWIILALLVAGGGTIKIVLTKRLTVKHGRGGFGKVVLAVFSGKTISIYISISIALVAGIVFAVNAGHPWYILSLAAFMVSIISFFMDILIDLLEYKAMGWIALLVGVLSLFMVESDPLLWAAIVSGGIFCGFGVFGVIRSLNSAK